MPAQCKGEEVKALNRLGHLEFTVRPDNGPAMRALRGAVNRNLNERFGVRPIAQGLPKYDSASAGMMENATKLVEAEVRTLVIATRELHGVVMDRGHVALRVAGQIISRTVKGEDWLSDFSTCISTHVSSESHASRLERTNKEGSNKKVHVTDYSQRAFSGHQKRIKHSFQEFYVGTPACCVVRSTVQ